MSTYESYAWIDVADRAGVDAVMAVLDDERVWKAPQTLRAAFYDTGQGWRIAVVSRDRGHDYMPDFVAHLMKSKGLIVRALVALDHDEYGAEHIVLFLPWFDALGIAFDEPVGAEMVLVRRRPVWREAFLRYAQPNLPGRWHVVDDAALMTPVDLIACGVQRGIHAGLRVVLQPLYQQIDSPLFLSHPDEVGTRRWGGYVRVEDAEDYMRDAVATIRNDVLPMLENYGSVDGYRRFCAEQAGDPDSPRSLYLLAATEIIRERYEDANAALDEAQARVRYQPDPWHPGPATPETRTLLLARAAEQRRLLNLPGSY